MMDHPKDAFRYRWLDINKLMDEAHERGIDDSAFERRDDYILALTHDDRERSATHGEVAE